jgi:hypothetical protein
LRGLIGTSLRFGSSGPTRKQLSVVIEFGHRPCETIAFAK